MPKKKRSATSVSPIETEERTEREAEENEEPEKDRTVWANPRVLYTAGCALIAFGSIVGVWTLAWNPRSAWGGDKWFLGSYASMTAGGSLRKRSRDDRHVGSREPVDAATH